MESQRKQRSLYTFFTPNNLSEKTEEYNSIVNETDCPIKHQQIRLKNGNHENDHLPIIDPSVTSRIDQNRSISSHPSSRLELLLNKGSVVLKPRNHRSSLPSFFNSSSVPPSLSSISLAVSGDNVCINDSSPLSIWNDKIKNHDPSMDYVCLGPDGIIELPTPERLGFIKSDGSSDGNRPKKRQKNRRRSAPAGQHYVSAGLHDTFSSNSINKVSTSPARETISNSKVVSCSKPKRLSLHQVATSSTYGSKKRSIVELTQSDCLHSLPTSDSLVQSMKEASLRWFGITELTQFQIQAIKSVFNGFHSLIVVPTGAGKSLCYQLPPLMSEANHKFVLVISPLISLMEDQVKALKQKNIPSVTTSGGKGKATIWSRIEAGDYRLLYCSPEYIELHKNKFDSIIDRVLLIAIDECHCVSEWGHSFRPAYKKIKQIRDRYPNIPCMCLTATATSEVQQDIVKLFQLRQNQTLHLRASVNRSNIFYKVTRKTSNIYRDFVQMFDLPDEALIQEQVKARSQHPVDNSSINPYSSTIIYVSTKNDADTLAKQLKSFGLAVDSYHSGHSFTRRTKVHSEFMEDRIQVICATIAFGMGIDKPDIRRIIHWCVPSSMEGYMQQSGRAGRDRQNSEAVLMWKETDLLTTENVLKSGEEWTHMSESYRNRLAHLFNSVKFYINRDKDQCLRSCIINYFGEAIVESTEKFQGLCRKVTIDGIEKIRCDFCSICCSHETTVTLSSKPGCYNKEVDLGNEARIILNCVIACKEKTGAGMPCKVAIGSSEKEVLGRKLNKHPCYGKGKSKPIAFWKELLNILTDEEYIKHEATVGGPQWSKNKTSKYIAVQLTNKGRNFLRQNNASLILKNLPKRILDAMDIQISPLHNKETKVIPYISASNYLKDILGELKKKIKTLRLIESRRRQCTPYQVLNTADLEKITHLRPSSITVLLTHIPQPDSSSRIFLQNVVDVIVGFCDDNGLDTNQIEALSQATQPEFKVQEVTDFDSVDEPDLPYSDNIDLSQHHQNKNKSTYSCYSVPSLSPFNQIPETSQTSLDNSGVSSKRVTTIDSINQYVNIKDINSPALDDSEDELMGLWSAR